MKKEHDIAERLIGEVDAVFWIMTVLFFLFAIGAVVMYFGKFQLPDNYAESVQFLSPAVGICACSYFVYLGYKCEGPDTPMIVIYTIIYIAICSLLLWLAYNLHLEFPISKESRDMGRSDNVYDELFNHLVYESSFWLWIVYIFMAAAGYVVHLLRWVFIDNEIFHSDIIYIVSFVLYPILSLLLIFLILYGIYRGIRSIFVDIFGIVE